MYFGDNARKKNLVEYGFRLPSAIDNRPMKFEEFENALNQTIYVSATPGDYELEKVNHQTIEQIIRPTGLIDPVIEVRETKGQIDDLISEIDSCISKNQRILITALTVKMAEDLTNYLLKDDYKVAYLHHEVKTLERITTILDLRKGVYDIIVGINLLREGLDIPEVALIAILDADKEGFLRSDKSLIQTIGRAARNSEGRVIMYADKITKSMKKAIDETTRRRNIQIEYNTLNNIIPKTIIKPIGDKISGKETKEMLKSYMDKKKKSSNGDKTKLLDDLTKQMNEAAKVLDFEKAAELRDIILEIKSEV